MKWSRAPAALVTAAALVVVVAVSTVYVLTALPGDPVLVTSAAPPQAQAWALPPEPVTLTARPTPKRATPPSRAPRPTAKPTPKRGSTTEPTPAVAPVPRHPVGPTAAPTAGPTVEPPAPPRSLDFLISSFNVLGSSHTRAAGDGWAPGPVRARWAAQIVRQHGSSVVGFQELEPDQLAVLRRSTDLDFWPGNAVRGGSPNSIGWRRDQWVAVERQLVGIPYFKGHRRPMPYVKLRNLRTGLEAWFANFHNPASISRLPNQQRYRTAATAIEIALANRLIRYGGGVPVFVIGDMNEKDEYFCRMTAGAPMVAARGGDHVGGCHPVRGAIDWIFGSQGVTFSGYREDGSALVHRTTDHRVVVATAHITGDAPRG